MRSQLTICRLLPSFDDPLNHGVIFFFIKKTNFARTAKREAEKDEAIANSEIRSEHLSADQTK